MSNSTNVETNVVQMRFDNKNFEKNIKQTTDSVDKLKKELKFEESAKSFKQLEENAKRVDFSPLTKGLEKVQASFSFLDTFSATVYHRLSNRLIDIGKKITTSVSTEGIKSGFSEYELKMNAFKTIQASAGKDFTDSQINKYLEELNKYADKTIYSFSDMTNNIGKFTNAGVKLDVAVKAIKGISNEAAVSGANAAEASRAMYNFSQALSAGYVKLIDWKSIENANMATEEFKNELIKTAVSVGKLTKAQNGMYKTQKGKLINSTRNFNDSLADQWMTTEVLTKTLEKYADETTEIGKKAFDAAQKVNTFSKLIDTLKESIQSGWSQTWELLIGNLKEATELWTLVSNKIGGVIDAFFAEKKAVLEDWKAHGGRNRMLKAMGEILKNIGTILNQIKKAWRDVFPKATVNTMMSLTESFENFANKTKVGSKTLDRIRDTFRGLFSAIMIVKDAITAFRQTFGKFFLKVLADALRSLFGVTGSLGDMLVQVRKHIKENKTFYKVFEAVVKVLDWVYSGVKKVAGVLWDFATAVGNTIKSFGGFDSITKWFDELFNAVKNFDILKIAELIWRLVKNIAKTIDKALEKTFDFYTPVKEKLIEVKNKIVNSKIVTWIVDAFSSLVSGIQNVFNSMKDVDTSGADELVEETEQKFSVFDKIASFFETMWATIKKIGKAIWSVFGPLLTAIGDGVKMLWDGITTNIKNSDLGDAGGFMAGAGLLGLFLGIKKFIDNMKPLFKAAKVFGDGKFLNNIFGILENASTFIKAKILKEIAVSILMLVGALFILCTLPKEKVVGATLAIGVLFQGMTSVFKSIDTSTSDAGKDGAKALTGRLFGMAAMILAISLAMVVLTSAMKKISKLSTEDITKGMIAVMLLFRAISSSVTTMLTAGQRLRGSKAGDVNITAKGVAGMIKGLGTAVLLIAAACWVLTKAMEEKDAEGNITLNPKRIAIPLIAIAGIILIIGRTASTILKYSKQLTQEGGHNIAILNGKGGTAVLILALAVFVTQFAKAFIKLIAAIAAISTLGKFIGFGNLWHSLGVMTAALLVVLGSMLVTVRILTKTADKMDSENGLIGVAKIGLLTGMVTLFITAMSGLLVALSLLPSDWAFTGASALSAIAISVSLVMAAMSTILKNSNSKVKGSVAIIGTITLALTTLVMAVAGLAKALDGTSSTKAVLILVGMAAAISGIILAVGHFQKFATGFKVFTTGLAAFGVAAAGFAAAALMIIFTLKQISKMSDDEISKIGTNIKKVTTSILSAADQLVGMLAGLIHMVVSTVIHTALTTILGSAGEIIDGLMQLCDVLLVKSPVLVSKVLQVLVEILSQLERDMGPLIVQIVSFVITFISEVAQAIKDNAPRIVQAIDDVLDAIATIVTQGIAKIFGFDKFETAVNTLKRIVKPVSAILIGMFAYKKVKNGSNTIIKIISSLKDRISSFKQSMKTNGFGNAWKEVLGISKLNEDWALAKTAYKEGWASLGEVTKVGGTALLKAAGIGAGIGAAIGSVAKAFIDAKTDALDATTSWAEDTDEELKKLRDNVEKTGNELRDARNKNKDAIKETNREYDTQEVMLKRLAKLYDPKTGKVLEGHEEEVKTLSEKINSALGTRLQLENQILSVIDEQGNKRKADLEQLQQIIEKERLKATLDKNKELIESYKGDKGQIQKQRTIKQEAEKNKVRYEELYAFLNESRKYTTDVADKLEGKKALGMLPAAAARAAQAAGKEVDQEKIRETINKLTEIYGDTSLTFSEMLQDLKLDITTQESYAKNAQAEIDRMNREVELYEKGVNAAITGTAKDIHDVNMSYLTGYISKNSGTKQQMSNALKSQMAQLDKMMENPTDYDKTSIKQYLEGMIKQMTELGYTKNTKIDGGKEILVKNQFGQNEKLRFDTYGELYAHYLNAFGSIPDLMEQEIVKGLNDMGSNKDVNAAVNGFSTDLKDGITGSFKDGLSSNAKGLLSSFISDKTNENGLLGFLRADTDTHSPSGLYNRELGVPLADGIIKGFEDTLNAYDPTTMSEGLLTKLRTVLLPGIASLTGESSSFGSITPVNFGLNQNGSSFSPMPNFPLAQSGVLPYAAHLDNINSSLNRLTERMVQQTDGIINELSMLRGDVTELGTRVSSMEVRLDGRTLVGELTPRINDALIQYGIRVERGV